MFDDDRNNLAAFPAWQAFLRERRPPTLTIWDHDPVFAVAEIAALKRNGPNAEAHILDARR
jgi:hypothetical protein